MPSIRLALAVGRCRRRCQAFIYMRPRGLMGVVAILECRKPLACCLHNTHRSVSSIKKFLIHSSCKRKNSYQSLLLRIHISQLSRSSSRVLALERTLRPPETHSATITDQERNNDLRLLTLE